MCLEAILDFAVVGVFINTNCVVKLIVFFIFKYPSDFFVYVLYE